MTPATPPPSTPLPEPRYGPDSLIPVVVQDVADGRVLMLAYADAEALAATVATGEVHFHSRSRDAPRPVSAYGRSKLAGEDALKRAGVPFTILRGLELDCDADALLVTVEPAGPTCHRGTRSCFDLDSAPATAPEAQGFAWLEALWATIADRIAARPEGSYTARLLDGGVDAVARKVTEEATEVLLAAKDDATAEAGGTDRRPTGDALAGETADLLYHTLVLLAERGVPPAAVIDALRSRHRPARS